MQTAPQTHLARLLPPQSLRAGALATLVTGGLLAAALLRMPGLRVPDSALRLAALAALPMPLVVLHLVTTPPNGPVRRLLGEAATAVVAASGREVVRCAVVALLLPLTVGAATLAMGQPDLLRVASLVAGTLVLAFGLAFAAMTHALRLLAGGRHAAWAAVGGGGAFGPAESAPLLYLPAFAWVAAVAPAAVLTAVWNVRPERVTPALWLGFPLAAAALSWRVAQRSLRTAGPWLHAGLCAAEWAHATRFAEADGLLEPPRWLTVGQPPPALRFLARAWHRAWPFSGPASFVLALATIGLVPPHVPFWLGVSLAFAFAAVALLRVVVLRRTAAWQASEWLGMAPDARERAFLRLGVGLFLPALSLGVAMAVRGDGPAATLGLALGAGFAALALWRRPVALLRPASWLILALALAIAALGAA